MTQPHAQSLERLRQAMDQTQQVLDQAEDLLERAREVFDQAVSVLTEMERVQQTGDAIETPLSAVMDYLTFLQETEGLSDEAHAYVSDAVMAYLSFLQDSEDHSPQARDAMQASRESSAHLLTLINDLLEYAKVLQGVVQEQPTVVALRPLVNEVHQSLAVRAQERQLEYSLKFEGDLPSHVTLDPSWLTQVLLEVLGNAIAHTPSGHVHTQVSVIALASPGESGDADHVLDGRAMAPMRESGEGLLRISVADTGVGIAQADQARIFEPFVQLRFQPFAELGNAGAHRHNDGNGLGLAIAQSLAQRAGAEIEVVSCEGMGSTFDIRWPVRWVRAMVGPRGAVTLASNDAAGGAVDGSSTQPNALRLLVVDDHQINRLVAMSALKRAFQNAQIDEAQNGSEAFELMSSHHYDAVLMDLVMPDHSGIDVVRRIRTLSVPFGDVPVIALTANVSNDTLHECDKIGINQVLSKPLDVAALIEAVRGEIS